ncbi:hypothetical protein MCOR25_009265 [Pyricularia grisea]|nr:hypothetical protein MCOR25_009265 [Pyricularia grisea]
MPSLFIHAPPRPPRTTTLGPSRPRPPAREMTDPTTAGYDRESTSRPYHGSGYDRESFGRPSRGSGYDGRESSGRPSQGPRNDDRPNNKRSAEDHENRGAPKRRRNNTGEVSRALTMQGGIETTISAEHGMGVTAGDRELDTFSGVDLGNNSKNCVSVSVPASTPNIEQKLHSLLARMGVGEMANKLPEPSKVWINLRLQIRTHDPSPIPDIHALGDMAIESDLVRYTALQRQTSEFKNTPYKYTCGNCDMLGHTVMQCVKFTPDGDVDACPLHNTREHSVDDCADFCRASTGEQFQLLVANRSGLWPIRSSDVCWTDLARRFPALDKPYPITYFEARRYHNFCQGNADMWRTWDYSRQPQACMVDAATATKSAIKKDRGLRECYRPLPEMLDYEERLHCPPKSTEMETNPQQGDTQLSAEGNA